MRLVYNTDQNEDRTLFAFNHKNTFYGKYLNDETESDPEVEMSDVRQVVMDQNPIQGNSITTIGEHVVCLFSVELIKQNHNSKASKLVLNSPKSSNRLFGEDFQNLNLRNTYVTKMNTVEAEKILTGNAWYCLRSKVHREVRQNAIILLINGKHGERGSQSISDHKEKCMGMVTISSKSVTL